VPTDFFEDIVGEAHGELRLDVYLAACIEDASRSYIQKLIKDGCAAVNGTVSDRPSKTLHVGDSVRIELPEPPSSQLKPEDIPLEILYQDSDVVVINKPSGLVVHPAPGHYTGTLVHALLHHCPDFQRSGMDPLRPGVVHRLDRFTSGVMVVAKTQHALSNLSQQAHDREFERRYLALVRGEFKEDSGRIVASIGRSLTDSGKMAVTGVRGREAITRFEVLERFKVASYVALKLETGRTHQIRVHMRFAAHPVLGDPLYGVTDFKKWAIKPQTLAALTKLEGQALHAEVLGFEHPRTKEEMRFTAPPPEDFTRALEALRDEARPLKS
jgi:23S rRNA pseudouridine1911/1915/1917 synthase